MRRPAQATCAACISLFLAPPVIAQQVPPERAVCVHGAVAHREPPLREVFATLEPVERGAADLEFFLGTLLQEISLVFQPPDSSAPLPAYSFTLRLHKDGRLSDAKPVESYIPAVLTNATLRAIDSVSKLGGIGPVTVEMPRDPLPLRMVFRLGDRPGVTSVPFYRMRFPAFLEIEVERPAVPIRGSPVPRYPRNLREQNIEGEVLLQFVVDTLGRIDTRTVRLLGPRTVYRGFLQSVVDILPKMRFIPAELGGCKVRQVVQLPFAFKLNR